MNLANIGAKDGKLGSLSPKPLLTNIDAGQSPTKIIQEIYSHLNLFIDAVCLGATCQVLSPVFLDRRLYQKYLVKIEGGEDFDGTLYSYPFDEISHTRFRLSSFWTNSGLYDRIPPFDNTSSPLQDLCGISSWPATSATWKVLRNLSRKQYVREVALYDLMGKYKDVDLRLPIPYVNWSVWAGDRFDVVKDSDALHEDVAWLDVSDKVLEELEMVWKWYHQC
ncbi:hypothetical protein B0H16DRAFT_1898921 [Mycena metata]|uniref:Uncharacterized protein n=1 Tax=Mycena metata TaxID=1033252 RepID=A0AAD7H8H8_9AGAR|nr:hypothetical protein B0H16DRAFT_1898921 [Mycena metata]